MSAADTIQQYLEFRTKKKMENIGIDTLFWRDHFSVTRTYRMIAFMAFFHVPYLHYFHKFMDARILRMGITNSTVAVITKVTLDQCLAAPPYMVWFLFMTSMLEGATMDTTKQRIQTNWWPMLLNCWKIWA